MSDNLSFLICRFHACWWATEFVGVTRKLCKLCKNWNFNAFAGCVLYRKFGLFRKNIPSCDLQPSRCAESGQTHVPVYSSKCKPAVQVCKNKIKWIEFPFRLLIISRAGYIQFQWHHRQYNWRRHCRHLHRDGRRSRFCVDISHLFPLVVLMMAEKNRQFSSLAASNLNLKSEKARQTYAIQYDRRNQHWMVDHIYFLVEWFHRTPNRPGISVRLRHHHHIRSICRTVLHLCTVHFYRLDTGNLCSYLLLFDRLQMIMGKKREIWCYLVCLTTSMINKNHNKKCIENDTFQLYDNNMYNFYCGTAR